MTVSVFIDGAAGTTGLDIRERLTGRTDIAIVTLPEDRRKDAEARRDALHAADAVILCLPDDAAREAVALIESPAVKVIDASTAHRVAEGWTYGFAELEPGQRQALSTATRISNPGCYPTGFLALIRPLVREGLIPADWPFTVNATSGYSGGGKAMITSFENGSAPDATDTAFRIYGLNLAHKHVPEMQVHGGLVLPPLFAPAVARTYSGMLVEVPLQLAAMPGSSSPRALRDALAAAYEGSALVRVHAVDNPALLTLEQCAGTDRLELYVFASATGDQVRLVAALDNLGKGAGGAAVQNLNIAMGFDETIGLRL
jgi:N-acetyl-gamma-glutamyl-phosphate reductase